MRSRIILASKFCVAVIHTWYRFKIRETLLKNPNPPYEYLFHSGPTDMLPIAEDEFLIHELNGQMEIDALSPLALERVEILLELPLKPALLVSG